MTRNTAATSNDLADLAQLLHNEGTATAAPSSTTTVAAVAKPSGTTALIPSGERLPYTHAAMISLMIQHPSATHAQLAAAFGRPASWLASVLASTDFQLALDPHRHLILDPALTATMEERFRSLALQSVDVLQRKLDGKETSDLLVLKAVELGVKALGLGNTAPVPAPPVQSTSADAVAERILAAMTKAKLRASSAGATDGLIIEGDS